MAAGDSVDQNDLKKVKGIGAKVEARLKGAGITSLGQLARTPVNELAAVLDGLTGKYDAHRISREKWVSQATALATVPATGPAEDESAKRVRHNFTVEVQLAVVGRDVVSSKVVHVQTGDEATWAGWEGQRVVAFIEDRAGLRPSAPALATKRDPPPGPEPAPGTGRGVRADGPGRALHTFAMVAATGPEITPGGAITATLSFDTEALALTPGQIAQAKADVYARRPPPAGSVPAGSVLADISPGETVRLQIPCSLPAIGHPVSLFAVVQLFAASEGRTPSSGLPNASMTLSKASSAAPGNPDPAADHDTGAV
jgi:hypothetical protein